MVEVGDDLYELMNPQIVKASGDDRDLEGCLSLPGYYAYVTRRDKVWVVAQNRHGKKIKVSGNGFLARAFQHELDHLERQAVHRLPRVDGRADPRRPGRRRGCRGGREGPRVTDTPARVIFLGSGGFAVPILYRLGHIADVDVVGVVSTPAKPAGRRGIVTPVPVAAAARKRGVPLMQPPSVRDPRAIAAIRELEPDLGILADYGKIVPQELLDVPTHGFLNVHPSLLPRHRGASPIPATILEGDTETGVTLIEMDAGLDTGPIVAAERWPLEGTETASELEARAAGVGAGLLSKTIGAWLRGEVAATPQGDDGATHDAAAPSRGRPARRVADGRRSWSARSAPTSRGPARSSRPPAGRLVVWGATVDGPTEETLPGTFGPGPDLRVATAENWLRLDEVQPGGGRRMPGDAWLRGRPAAAGSAVS